MSDFIRREDATAVIRKTLGSLGNSVVTEINSLPGYVADRPTGRWKEVYSETDYRNGWIEFSCECCEHQHGLESGEYGWSYGEPIPWKFCPLCGAKMEVEE